jgi:hypothetical protein
MVTLAVRLAVIVVVVKCAPAADRQPFRPEIPKVWDEQALREMELPVVVPRYSPRPVSADYYTGSPFGQSTKAIRFTHPAVSQRAIWSGSGGSNRRSYSTLRSSKHSRTGFGQVN